MDLSGLFQTTATLAPVLLIGQALAPPFHGTPKSRLRSFGRLMYMGLPPMVVMWLSLWMLSGAVPKDWSDPVMIIVLGLLGLHMGGGVVGITLSDKLEMFLLPDRTARQKAAPDKQPHSQPHKPDRTTPDEVPPSTRDGGSSPTEPDPTEPERTAGRHS